MDAEIPINDPLQSLDYAITEAFRNGASQEDILDYAIAEAFRNGVSQEDIARVAASTSLKLHPSKTKGYLLEMKPIEGWFVSNRAFYRIGFVVIALVLALNSVATSCSVLRSTIQSSQNGFEPPNPSNTTPNPPNETVDNNHDQTNSTEIRMDDEESKLRTFVHPEWKGFDFHEMLLNVKKDDLDHSCPLDAFFNDACRERAGGKVCVYHDTILKKIDKKYIQREITAIEKLNDPRFFPNAYHIDEKCATVVVENVRPKDMSGDYNNPCANYTYYEDFYKGAFDIFNKQNIYPQDLNVCCNTIIHDDFIKIIDFGQYEVDLESEEVREKNEKLLEEILEELKETIKDRKWSCEKRSKKKEQERKEEEERQKEEERKKEEKRKKKLEQKKEEERKQELKRQQEEEKKEAK